MRDQRSFLERLADQENDRLMSSASDDYSRYCKEKRRLERMCFVLLRLLEVPHGVTHVVDKYGEVLDVKEHHAAAVSYFSR